MAEPSDSVPVLTHSFYSAPLAGRGDVIVVSISYKLGILGFADMEELAPGNLGLFDQRLALKWVRDNLRAFGGNPDGVTLMGVSAGSMAISAHIMTPLNQRGPQLFHCDYGRRCNGYGCCYQQRSQPKQN